MCEYKLCNQCGSPINEDGYSIFDSQSEEITDYFETQEKLDKVKELLFTLKTLDHHSLSEEMWRIDKVLKEITK